MPWKINRIELGCNVINPLNFKLIPICHLLALLGAHHILHVSRVRVKGTEYFVPLLTSVVISEGYYVNVNNEVLVGSTEYLT
jgi:hypothetical protein